MDRKKYNDRPRCYCGAGLLDDGTCRYRCPPEANPRHLRKQAGKRRANEKHATLRGVKLTDEENRRASDAVSSIDPTYKKQRITFGAVAKAGQRR
jgi:hypothetical protein